MPPATNASTIPTFKAALLTRLAADAGLTGVLVTYGVPFQIEQIREEWVWLSDTDQWTQAAAAIGRQKREETYRMQIVVSVMNEASTPQQTTTERAFAIAAVIESSIRLWGQGADAADPFSNSASGVRFGEVVGQDYQENADTKNRECRLTLGVLVHARI